MSAVQGDQVEQGQVVAPQNEVITSDSAESQLPTMIETPVNANEVPQELFMNTDEIVDSKETLNLQPVTEAEANLQPSTEAAQAVAQAVEMAMVRVLNFVDIL